VQDTTHFIQEMEKLNHDQVFTESNARIGTLDVDALYPNIDRDLAVEALKDALESCTSYPEDVAQVVLDLTRFCLENSVVHYRGSWFRSKDGVPTGGPESGSIANIYVKWMLDKRLLTHPSIVTKNKLSNRKRFLDDLWFLWYGTDRQFSLFLTALNDLGAKDNFTLKGSVGDSIEFLDVKLTVKDGNVDTTIYIKPTDSTRYLNRRSDHSSHMFKAIPFSQFRRAIVICSSADESRRCIEHMEKKFIDSGYSREELLPCKEKALALDRDTILREHRSTGMFVGEEDILTFVINHDPDMV